MRLKTSAHIDTFTRDNLPPEELWPTLEFTIPDVQYPDILNAGHELIDRAIETYGPDKPAFHTPDGGVWTYGAGQRRTNQIAQARTEDYGVVAGTREVPRGADDTAPGVAPAAVPGAACVVVGGASGRCAGWHPGARVLCQRSATVSRSAHTDATSYWSPIRPPPGRDAA